jgi:hypothetical protein
MAGSILKNDIIGAKALAFEALFIRWLKPAAIFEK